MAMYIKINMDIGLDGPLAFDENTVVKSCVFYWGQYNPNYPYNRRGFRDDGPNRQIEFTNIPVRDINWVITELHKMECE